MLHFQFEASDCQKKWTNIRDTYQKQKGKPLGTGSAAELKQKRQTLLSFVETASLKRNA